MQIITNIVIMQYNIYIPKKKTTENVKLCSTERNTQGAWWASIYNMYY